jgi:hypothetical protein
MKSSIFKVLMAMSLTVGLTQTQIYQSNAITQGEKCSKINQKRKVGKIELRCIGTERIKYWIQTPTTVPAQKSLAKILTQWGNEMRGASFDVFVTPADVENANNDLAKITQAEGFVTSELAASEKLADSYKTTASTLEAVARDSGLLAAEKKKIYEAAQIDFQAAQNRTNSYNSQYQAALSSRSANLACAVLKDFGFVGSCATNNYQDALDVQTIRTYEGLKIASDAARAKFVSAVDAFIATSKKQSKELNDAKLALDTSDLHNLRSIDWKTKAEFVASQKEYVESYLGLADLGTGLQKEFSDMASSAFSAVDAAKSASARNLKTRYQEASNLVAFVRLANKEYEKTLNEKVSYSAQEINTDKPQIWKPSDYLKGSTYQDIQNTSGVDFGWSWAKASNCVQYTSCENVFVTTSKDCAQATVTLDFMTASKVSENKSSSRPFMVKSGEISIVEIESKYTDTAKNAYLRAFTCTSSQ